MMYVQKNLVLSLLSIFLLLSNLHAADIIIDNDDPRTSYTGTWRVSGADNPWDPADVNATSLWSRDGATYTWHADLPESGIYDVYMWCTYYASRATNAPITIQYDGGSVTIPVNQQENASTWYHLGAYNFSSATGGTVIITAEDSYPTSYCADAVKFVTAGYDGQVVHPHLKSWSKAYANASKRFVLLSEFNNEAVLDRETGLVWDKSPRVDKYTWKQAFSFCLNYAIGKRKGWHLPTAEEISSLVYPDLDVEGRLPIGHPFDNVQVDHYWTATTSVFGAESAFYMNFDFGTGYLGTASKDLEFYTWCVRGGHGHDAY